MARKRSIYPFLYWSKRRDLLRYAKILEKRGYKIDYSTFPKELKRPNKYSWERIESWTHEDVRLRATKVVNGRTLKYKDIERETRSKASQKGWVTRRARQVWTDFKDDVTPWDEADGVYYPDEGAISLNNFGKTIHLSSDFLENILRIIENSRTDSRYARRNIRYLRESNAAGDYLNNYIISLLANDEKRNAIYSNVVSAGTEDSIYTMVYDMMFADSKSKRSALTTTSTIQRILEGLSVGKTNTSEVIQEWDADYF